MFELVSVRRARANRLDHVRVEDAAILCVWARERVFSVSFGVSLQTPAEGCVGHMTHLSFERGITLAVKLVPEPCGVD